MEMLYYFFIFYFVVTSYIIFVVLFLMIKLKDIKSNISSYSFDSIWESNS